MFLSKNVHSCRLSLFKPDQILKFSVVDIFTECLHAGRGTIDMKRIKRGSSLKAWVGPTGTGLKGWRGGQNSTFRIIKVLLHIKLKGMTHAATW